MSIAAIAKKDFRDAIRSPYFWAVTLAVTLAIGIFLFQVIDQVLQIVSEAERQTGEEVELSTDLFVQALRFGFQIFVPLLAIVAAYTSIAGERASGSLKLLLSLPNSRWDVVMGKLLGRFAVVAIPLLIAFVIGALVFPLSQFTFVPETYAVFALLTLFLGIVFVAFTMGVSAAATTTRRAAVVAFGVYAYFVIFWARFARNFPGFLQGFMDYNDGVRLQLEVGLQILNPMSAYRTLVYSRRLDAPMEARAQLIQRGGSSGQPNPRAATDTLDLQRYLLHEVFVDQIPWYLSDAVVVFVLLLWVAVPLAIGYYLFSRADL